MGLDLLLESVKVLTFTIGEPHKQTPSDLVGMILEDTDETSFEDVQFNVLLSGFMLHLFKDGMPVPEELRWF